MKTYKDFMIERVTPKDWVIRNADGSQSVEAIRICEMQNNGRHYPLTLKEAKTIIDLYYEIKLLK